MRRTNVDEWKSESLRGSESSNYHVIGGIPVEYFSGWELNASRALFETALLFRVTTLWTAGQINGMVAYGSRAPQYICTAVHQRTLFLLDHAVLSGLDEFSTACYVLCSADTIYATPSFSRVFRIATTKDEGCQDSRKL